jgi:ATP-binding cassette subfamily B protein
MQIDYSAFLKSSTSLAGVRALVVDDEIEARELVQTLLERHGATVITAGSGSEAIALLDTSFGTEQQLDLFICDIALPDQDGYEIMRRVRVMEIERGIDQTHHLLTIAMTGFDRPTDRVRALEAGYQMHVPKPVEPAELFVVIRSLLKRRDYLQ